MSERGFFEYSGLSTHCRVAHKCDYTSHDAAVMECGRPLIGIDMAHLLCPSQSTANCEAHEHAYMKLVREASDTCFTMDEEDVSTYLTLRQKLEAFQRDESKQWLQRDVYPNARSRRDVRA